MKRLRSSARSALIWAAVANCALAPVLSPAHDGHRPTSQPPAGPAAVATLRALLDTAARGSAATYAQLGLRAGPAVQEFYQQREFAPAWTRPDSGWNHTAQRALQLLRRAPEFGLVPAAYAWTELRALPDSVCRAGQGAALGNFELRLTDALLRYATHLRYGQLVPATLAPAPVGTAVGSEMVSRLQQALAGPQFETEFLQCQPGSAPYRRLQQTWARTLHPAPDSAQPAAGNAADARRVALNLERLRWETARPDTAEYALVNIPAYRLQLVRRGRVVQSHRVVVGKPDTPTPTLDSRIRVFVTAPDWRVPYSIAVNEILPELQDDPGFLADNNYRLFDGRNRPVNPWQVRWDRVTPQTFAYNVRQTAGRQNALGNIVFYFANQHLIYLHDTPARSLFREPRRARSHGCVRVEKPMELAVYLLRREGQLGALPDIRRSVASRTKCRFDLAQGLPIRIRYYTCEAENGRLRFYNDVYCHDEILAAALERY